MPRARQRPPKPKVEVAPVLPEVVQVPDPAPLEEPRGSLFEDLDDEDVVLTVTAKPDDIPPVDSDLTPDEKKQFIDLLNKAMPIEDRAKQLALLARKTGQKTAAVGLRAIQEINEITGLRRDRPTEAAPMFALPQGSSVSVHVTKVVK